MNENLIAKSSITINAPAAKVWDALVNPAMIKQYLFGTDAVSDWKVGSPILYKGEWKGQTYEDKGVILKMVPEHVLETTYWSSMSGKADMPENYQKVTYSLTGQGDQTVLTITNDNNGSEEGKAESENNWNMVLSKLKQLVEK